MHMATCTGVNAGLTAYKEIYTDVLLSLVCSQLLKVVTAILEYFVMYVLEIIALLKETGGCLCSLLMVHFICNCF